MSASEEVPASQRSRLTRLFRYFALVIAAAVVYVLLDFAIDIRPPAVQASYRFNIAALEFDQPRVLRHENLSILLIRRSADTLAALERAVEPLQDRLSRSSRQPDYARNPLRSRQAEYFVSYALGTDFGCPLRVLESTLQETCGSATYDFAGRALAGTKSFPNLAIPDYTFASNFSHLTIRP